MRFDMSVGVVVYMSCSIRECFIGVPSFQPGLAEEKSSTVGDEVHHIFECSYLSAKISLFSTSHCCSRPNFYKLHGNQ